MFVNNSALPLDYVKKFYLSPIRLRFAISLGNTCPRAWQSLSPS